MNRTPINPLLTVSLVAAGAGARLLAAIREAGSRCTLPRPRPAAPERGDCAARC